jgi:hypothetical protein
MRYSLFLLVTILFLTASCADPKKISFSAPCPECQAAENNGLIESKLLVDSAFISPSDSNLAGFFHSLTKPRLFAPISNGETVKDIYYDSKGCPLVALSSDYSNSEFYSYDSLGFVERAGALGIYAKHLWGAKTFIDSSEHVAFTTYRISLNDGYNEFQLKTYYSSEWRMDSADAIDFWQRDPCPMYKVKYAYDDKRLIKQTIALAPNRDDTLNKILSANVKYHVPWYWRQADTILYKYTGDHLTRMERRTTYAPIIGVVRWFCIYDKEELCRYVLLTSKKSFVRYKVESTTDGRKEIAAGNAVSYWLDMVSKLISALLFLYAIRLFNKEIRKAFSKIWGKIFRRSK